MARQKAELTLGRVSSEAVIEATGRDWEQWLTVLDRAGATDLDHKKLVAHLKRKHPEVKSSWWHQSIAVAYERARGKRAVGQTAITGFQLGVQRSGAWTIPEAWELITSRPELWLGEGASLHFEEGEQYKVPTRSGAPRASGEVRVVKPGHRLRMTWHPEGWPAPATLQLTLMESAAGKTAIHAQLEKLSDASARGEMRARWRAALERIATVEPLPRRGAQRRRPK